MAVSVDWSNLSSLISGAATLFPGIVDLVTGAVPVIFVLIIVGFVVAFFRGLVDGIADLMRWR